MLKSKGKLKKFVETNDNENITQSLWDAAKVVYSNTILPQETRKISNRQPNFTPKTTGKRRTKTNKQTKKPKISRRKEIIKI